MAEVVAGGPAQDADRCFAVHKIAQCLARLVPVDQEDQPGPEKFEEFVDAGGILGAVAPRQHNELPLPSKVPRAFLRKRAPNDRVPVEEPHEELRARPVNVGIGDGDFRTFDVDDNDMRIGRADVVLDDKPAAAARCGGAKAGMAESQAARPVEPAHESPDTLLFGGRQPVHPRSRQRLDGGLRLDPVQRLVHVHDEQMLAIGTSGAGRGHGGDRPSRQQIAFGRRIGGPQRREAFREGLSFAFIRKEDGRQHRIDVRIEPLYQLIRAGNKEPAIG